MILQAGIVTELVTDVTDPESRVTEPQPEQRKCFLIMIPILEMGLRVRLQYLRQIQEQSAILLNREVAFLTLLKKNQTYCFINY